MLISRKRDNEKRLKMSTTNPIAYERVVMRRVSVALFLIVADLFVGFVLIVEYLKS